MLRVLCYLVAGLLLAHLGAQVWARESWVYWLPTVGIAAGAVMVGRVGPRRGWWD